jgi:hypothetical protein
MLIPQYEISIFLFLITFKTEIGQESSPETIIKSSN